MAFVTEKSLSLVSCVRPQQVAGFVWSAFRKETNRDGPRLVVIPEDEYLRRAGDPGISHVLLIRFQYQQGQKLMMDCTRLGLPQIKRRFELTFGLPAPSNVIYTFFQGEITQDWVYQVSVEAQVVSKAFFSDGDVGRARRVQMLGSISEQRDVYVTMQKERFVVDGMMTSYCEIFAAMSFCGKESPTKRWKPYQAAKTLMFQVTLEHVDVDAPVKAVSAGEWRHFERRKEQNMFGISVRV
ncbi:hypothetical protein LSTR_LSTR010913 [Laodelphax striatellus]|uniref:Uncharacterized protein n=1 Tax=Laodelphax striatellus TaxID=195883 RepID=A0A482WZV3_LAOST|nr:hypothetical protein LSTR_LSTR010913 [Laodelphax striatellus]